jgi:hypothetical protein
MRRLTLTLGLAAVCVLCTSASALAFGDFAASRIPTPCSTESPCPTSGKSIESQGTKFELSGEHNQHFKFGPFNIYCKAAAKAKTIGEGAVTWELSPDFATEIKFTKCLTKLHAEENFAAGVPTKFNVNPETKKSEPIKVVYHNNGTAEFGTGEVEGEAEVGAGTAGFSIGAKICKISWPAQKVPLKVKEETEYSFAKYSTNEVAVSEKQLKKFPTGFQKKLVIFSAFKKMKWEDEEGQCLGEGGFEEEAKHTEGNTGVYEGAIEYTLTQGNIWFE